jgi:gluconokinase
MGRQMKSVSSNLFIILMGVSGSGKTTIGRALSEHLGWAFYDGDNYHPPENVSKMAAGIPLNDDDRAGWLAALAQIIRDGLARGENGIMACSALKQKYRNILQVDPVCVHFVYLKGSYEIILGRMESREGHYMKSDLLESQYAALEEPTCELVIDVSQSPQKIMQIIINHFDLTDKSSC